MASVGYLKDKEGNRFYVATHAKYVYLDDGSNVADVLSRLKNQKGTWSGTLAEWNLLDKTNIEDGTAVFIPDEGIFVFNKITGQLVEIAGSGAGCAIIIDWDDTSEPQEAWESYTTKTPKDGQIIILKDPDDKLMGYVWDETDSKWYVFSGNVDASNVIFREDITCAGEYTRVGNVTKTQNGTTKINAKNKSLEDVMKTIFTKELQPTITDPSVSVTLNQAGAYEVGTIISPTYTARFNPGTYLYGPSTGVTVDSWEISDSDSHTSSDSSGAFDTFTVTDSTNYHITAKANHTDGVYAKTNIGSTTSAKINAGSKISTSGRVTGYRALFYGIVTDDNALSSDKIRILNNNGKAMSGKVTVNVDGETNAKRIIVALPTSYNLSVTKVEKTDGLITDITTTYSKVGTTQVNDTQGGNPVSYDIWVYQPAKIDPAEVHQITIG